METHVTDRPLAVKGLTSYRCRGTFFGTGDWIMIGAKNHADAMIEALRSSVSARKKHLEIWNGKRYVKATSRNDPAKR